MSKPEFSPPAFVTIHGSEHPLSGSALLEMMRATTMKGSHFRFRALGFSMNPFLKNGDIVTVAPIEGRIRLGEIVAFIHPNNNRLVVHRVVGFQGKDCWIQGDNLPGTADGLLNREGILGRVVRVERDGRKTRLGLGPERVIIAIFSRRGWLPQFLKRAVFLRKLWYRRPPK